MKKLLKELSLKELKEVAKTRAVNLKGNRRKEDILKILIADEEKVTGQKVKVKNTLSPSETIENLKSALKKEEELYYEVVDELEIFKARVQDRDDTIEGLNTRNRNLAVSLTETVTESKANRKEAKEWRSFSLFIGVVAVLVVIFF